MKVIKLHYFYKYGLPTLIRANKNLNQNLSFNKIKIVIFNCNKYPSLMPRSL